MGNKASDVGIHSSSARASYPLCDFLLIFPSIRVNPFLEWAFMNQWIFIAVLSVVEALRRLWQKLTGRTPVPIRVRARWSDSRLVHDSPSSPFSRSQLNGQPVVLSWRDCR
jgi:hypothetical protein